MQSSFVLAANVAGALGAPVAVFAEPDTAAPTAFVKDTDITIGNSGASRVRIPAIFM
jgi:hypothetical protein